jgi:molybdopterin-guanine dinucleotide biosynthesis protein A
MSGAIILAGGKGDRIGGDKPFIRLGDRPLISYTLEVVTKISRELIIVVSRDVREPTRFNSLIPKNAKIIEDVHPEGGPLIGVYSGLKHMNSKYVAILPCDAPFVNEGVLRYLLKRSEDAHAVIPIWPNGYIEPLHAVYKVTAARKASRKAIEEGKKRVNDMVQRLEKTIYVPVEELKIFDQELLTFHNINSMEDLENAEKILKIKNRKHGKK